MHAIEVQRFGPPDVLQMTELPDPAPGAGQVLVAAAACDVLFVDTMIRSGRGHGRFPVEPPYVPGNGVGGTVVAVGESVGSEWVGRRVVAHTGAAFGGYAELVATGLEDVSAIPDGVDLLDATAVLHDGTTALRVLEISDPRPGDWVLVLGAAGGMGILLVQLLTASGAKVIGAARGTAKLAAVTRAGALAAIDYERPDWATAVLDATGGARPAVVLDGVGGALGGTAFELVADGGRFSAHGAPSGSITAIDSAAAARRGVRSNTIADLQYGAGDRARLTGNVLKQLAAGQVSPLIGQTYPLAEAVKAHAGLEERRALAKTLLSVG